MIKKVLSVLWGAIEVFVYGGITFGWASLVFVLKKEGFYANVCDSYNSTNVNSTVVECAEQNSKMILIMTIFLAVGGISTFFTGYFYDKFGLAYSRLLGGALYVTSLLCLALITAKQQWMLFPATILLNSAGFLTLTTNMPLSNLIPRARSTIITLYNGFFAGAIMIFELVKMAYEGGISLQISLSILALGQLICLGFTIFILPRKNVPWPLPKNYEIATLLNKFCRKEKYVVKEEKEEKTFIDDEQNKIETVNNPPKMTFVQCLLTPQFLLHLAFMCVIQLRLSFYLATLNPWLSELTGNDPKLISLYTNIFSYIQLASIAYSPFGGLIVDKFKADLRVLGILLLVANIFGLIIAIPGMVRSLPLQILGFICLMGFRGWAYAFNPTVVALIYPGEHFGKLFGVILMVISVFGLMQFPLFKLLHGPFNGNMQYTYTNILKIKSWDDVITKYWRENRYDKTTYTINNTVRIAKDAPSAPILNEELKDAIYKDKTLYTSSEDEYLSKRGYSCASSLMSIANTSKSFLKHSSIAHIAITGREHQSIELPCHWCTSDEYIESKNTLPRQGKGMNWYRAKRNKARDDKHKFYYKIEKLQLSMNKYEQLADRNLVIRQLNREGDADTGVYFCEKNAPRGSESIFYLLEYLNNKLYNITSSRNTSHIYKPPTFDEFNKPIEDPMKQRKDIQISNKLILIYLDIEYNVYQLPPNEDQRYFMERVCLANDKQCLWKYKLKPSISLFDVGLDNIQIQANNEFPLSNRIELCEPCDQKDAFETYLSFCWLRFVNRNGDFIEELSIDMIQQIYDRVEKWKPTDILDKRKHYLLKVLAFFPQGISCYNTIFEGYEWYLLPRTEDSDNTHFDVKMAIKEFSKKHGTNVKLAQSDLLPQFELLRKSCYVNCSIEERKRLKILEGSTELFFTFIDTSELFVPTRSIVQVKRITYTATEDEMFKMFCPNPSNYGTVKWKKGSEYISKENLEKHMKISYSYALLFSRLKPSDDGLYFCENCDRNYKNCILAGSLRLKIHKKPPTIFSIRFYRSALLISYIIDVTILCGGCLIIWFRHKRQNISRNRYKNLLEKSLPRQIKKVIKKQAMDTLGKSYKSLQCRELQVMIATEDVILIDVRTKIEVTRTGLIPKAFILPDNEILQAMLLDKQTFSDIYQVKKPYLYQKIVVYGKINDSRAFNSYKNLEYLGFDTFLYPGGWEEWKLLVGKQAAKKLTYLNLYALQNRESVILHIDNNRKNFENSSDSSADEEIEEEINQFSESENLLKFN
ncbi:DgyrCDS5546 [Dimorphilus gyrociliatus]|uniref:DgyrCDS5546 n=1 Tax=Dimorphilus gyrociliatus TaxID=2664684 RepID=A0A7I8VK71_9ANNE|nr:DgyrCDS5546 [Dimorphilus gyrociliatus]